MLSSWSYQTCLSHAPSSRLQWLLSLWQTHWEIISLGSMLKKKPSPALSLCRSEVNPRFIEMCTEDWKGTGSENLVTMYTTSKLLCQGLSCRLFFGTLSEAWYRLILSTRTDYAIHITVRWTRSGRFFSIHVVFFDDIQFLQVLTSFRWFPSSQEDSSLPESKTLLTLYWGISIKPETFLKPRSGAKS